MISMHGGLLLLLIMPRARAHIYWNCVDVPKRYAYIPLRTGYADIALAQYALTLAGCACVYAGAGAGAGAGADDGTVLVHCCVMQGLTCSFPGVFAGLRWR